MFNVSMITSCFIKIIKSELLNYYTLLGCCSNFAHSNKVKAEGGQRVMRG